MRNGVNGEAARDKTAERRVRRTPFARLVPWAALLLGLATTAVLDGSIVRVTEKRHADEFEREVGRLKVAIQEAVLRQASVLHATAGAVASDPKIDQRHFAEFYTHLTNGADAQIPAAIGLSLARPWNRRAELAQEAARRGAKNYVLRPPGPRPEAHAVILLMPQDDRNKVAPGYDMHAEPVRRLAMDKALAVDGPVMTTKVFLAKDPTGRRPALILYLPVHDPMGGDFVGFVYLGLYVDGLFSGLFSGQPDYALGKTGIHVWAGGSGEDDLVYERSLPGDRPFVKTVSCYIPEVRQTLVARVEGTPDFGTPGAIRQWVKPVGAILSILLFLLAGLLRRAHEDSERQTEEQALLAEVGRLTANRADTEDVLRGIAQATGETLGAVCRIDLLDGEGAMRTVTTRVEGLDALAALEREFPRLQNDVMLRRALDTGKTQRSNAYESIDKTHRERIESIKAGPVLIAPLWLGDRSLGAITLVRTIGARVFSDDAAALAESIASRMALAIDNVRLYRDLERRVDERTRDLEASNHELESFCYSVSHDLRTPLRSLDGFGRALREDYGDLLDKQGLDYIDRIRASTKRMDELITALLTLSRLTRREIVPAEVDVTGLAKDVMLDIDPENAVRLEVEEGLTVWADPRMFAVVLDNLLSNAVKFSSRGESPVVAVGRSPDGSIFVRDNGAGFDMAYSGKLFQPFERLHSAREFPGHGIGLATVERILRRHGGEVRAESVLGQGATFYVKFPS